LKRLPKRGVFDREKVYEILDEAFVCHLGFQVEGRPFVIPTAYGRLEDELFIHGSSASRTLRTLSGNVEICVAVTLVDGLVLARSAFHHSMNYRSVVIFGTASVIEDTSEKNKALRAFSDHVIPHRWNDVREPNENELRKTLVLRLPLVEASAKVRIGPPLDDEEDYELPTWAGEILMRLVAQDPIADPRLPLTTEIPSYINSYRQGKRKVSEIDIRLAIPDDASAVSGVLEKAFIEYRELYSPEGFAATVITADKVTERMVGGPMWIALYNDEIVGTVAAVSNGEALHVRGMGIVPVARGKRIGELLLNQVEAFAATHSHLRMTLHTTPFLSRAIRLYKRFGFQRSKEASLDLFGTPLFAMVKELSAIGQSPE
jgi:nitroimidazol reductase NimA-like FMN-containing flavoprotein (pyridoxamine 5'-phosphate oxidase superfamily)/GNAT superfamily N-acetyltransferase